MVCALHVEIMWSCERYPLVCACVVVYVVYYGSLWLCVDHTLYVVYSSCLYSFALHSATWSSYCFRTLFTSGYLKQRLR